MAAFICWWQFYNNLWKQWFTGAVQDDKVKQTKQQQQKAKQKTNKRY